MSQEQKNYRDTFLQNSYGANPLPVCCISAQEDFLYATPAFFSLMGKEQHISGTPLSDVFGLDAAKLVSTYVQKTLLQGFDRFSHEYAVKEQESCLLECTLTLLYFEQEPIIIMHMRPALVADCTHSPVTMQQELKESQALLKANEERIQKVFDAMPFGATFWNENHQCIDCNESEMQKFGLRSKQEYCQRFFEFCPEFQPNESLSTREMQRKLNEAFRDGSAHFEWMHHNAHGHAMPTEMTFIRTQVRDEYFITGFSRDLTELRAMQKKAEMAEVYNQLMLDSFPMGAHFWDADLQLLDCNLEVVNLFGFFSKEEYIAEFASTIPERQPSGEPSMDFFQERLRQALVQGTIRFEFIAKDPITELDIPLDVKVTRISYDNEFYILSYFRDIREWVAVMAEIQKVQDDLRGAKELAEQHSRTKSEFLANMSHEIRTPMNGILGLLHLLDSTKLSEQQKGYMQKSLFSANNLLRIINDILDFSKIEAGKLEIEATPFTLAQVCKEAYSLYAPLCQEKGLRLTVDGLPCAQEFYLGDALRVKQVIFNLLSNAIKFTHKGYVSLRVCCERLEDTSQVRCCFAVKDSGIGMSVDQLSKMFTAFSQADGSIARKYGGTGLGLAICRSLVEKMHGKIWVESEEGAGSTFFFTIDFEVCQEQLPVQELGGAGEDYQNYATGNLLLVEDNEINQLIAEELLCQMGNRVDIANNGQEALDLLCKKSYDLVLMDIQMPIMDGYTATKKIRSLEQFNSLPIVAMSAHAMSGDKELSLSHGMNDHITKPIDPEILYKTVHYWIKNSQQHLGQGKKKQEFIKIL